MRLAWAHARAETLQLVRIPAYAVATLAFPVVAVLLFGGRVDDEPERLALLVREFLGGLTDQTR